MKLGAFETETIQIVVKTQTGVDDFNAPIYEETTEDVAGVLIAPVSADDVLNTMNIHGKHAVYNLAIPKGDTHDWVDTLVILPEPFAGKYRTIGIPIAGIEANIPLSWNKQIKVEKYVEGGS